MKTVIVFSLVTGKAAIHASDCSVVLAAASKRGVTVVENTKEERADLTEREYPISTCACAKGTN